MRVGRTFNVGNYSNYRFEAEADLEEEESWPVAMQALYVVLRASAFDTMRADGVRYVHEPHGTISLVDPQTEKGDDTDDIPF